jgi:hypothetical protein
VLHGRRLSFALAPSSSFSSSSFPSFSIRHWNDDRMLSSVGTGWWRSKNKREERVPYKEEEEEREEKRRLGKTPTENKTKIK